jgi:hypothetical protein
MRRGFRRGTNPNIPPLLQRANELLAQEDYAGASAAFEQLAQAAEGRNGPRAPRFFMQAGRARLLAGQPALGVTHLKHGLTLFAARRQWGRFQLAGQRAVAGLNQHGLTEEAKDLAEYVASALPAGFVPPAMQAPGRRPILPTHCPSCGGAVRPDEVEWLDEVTAECDYCGSPVRGEA